MSQPDLTEQFAQTFEKESGSLQPGDPATEKWEALRDTMYRTALATFGKRSSKDVCKRVMKALDINTDSWEDLAADRMMWRSTLNQRLKTEEKKLVIWIWMYKSQKPINGYKRDGTGRAQKLFL